jgi:hypothetical protein
MEWPPQLLRYGPEIVLHKLFFHFFKSNLELLQSFQRLSVSISLSLHFFILKFYLISTQSV